MNEPELIECSICMDVLQTPVLIPCSHLYCRDCISSIIDTNHQTEALCPLCRSSFTRRDVTPLEAFTKEYCSAPPEDNDENHDIISQDIKGKGKQVKENSKQFLRIPDEMHWQSSSKIDKTIEILRSTRAEGNEEKTVVSIKFTIHNTCFICYISHILIQIRFSANLQAF